MTPCPPIATFRREGGPDVSAWCGFFVSERGFLPMVFRGAAEADVVERALAFWREESAKAQRQIGSRPRRLEALAKARAAKRKHAA